MIPALLGTFATWALLSLPPVTEPQPPAAPPTAPEPEPVVESMSLAPSDSDEYARLVQRAEAGEPDVDYRAMRHAYFDSAARDRANNAYDEIEALRKRMREGMKADVPERVREAARGILRFQYTDLEAQQALHRSCELLDDGACAAKHRDVVSGLVRSILSTGDGRTCRTGWKVVSVDEEYFLLRMMRFNFERQGGPSRAEPCDAMTGTDADGKPRTVYFNVEFVLQQWQRIFKE